MKKSIAIHEGIIISKIYFLREYKVILDDDLADLYQVETRRLNEQVKRNIDRFPYRKRVGELDIAKCDIKVGWTKKNTLCVHRAWCTDVIQRIKQ